MNDKIHRILASAAAAVALGSAAHAISYTGSLSYSADIFATPAWNQTTTTLSWVVSDSGLRDNGSIVWNYEYTWSTASKALSHLIIELSNVNVVITDLKVNGVPGTLGAGGHGVIGTYSPSDPGNSNPSLPGTLVGIKLDDKASLTTTTFSFNTVNSPVWGDFYAKDGKTGGVDTLAYNTGFLAADPTDAPSNGSRSSHLLRPDTVRTPAPTPIQTPDTGSTVILLGLALGGLGLYRKKNLG